jgi:hypothetical protein
MKIGKYILMLLMSVSCLSCMAPFDMKLEDEPMIFLGSFPGVEDVIVFDVQPAYSYSNSALRPEFKPVITLMVNGTKVPVVRNTGFCVSDKYPEDMYIADHKPVPGEEMTVEVSSEGFVSISASTSIPQPFPARKVDYRVHEVGEREYYMIHVTFMDDGHVDCAYGLQVLNERKGTNINGESYTNIYKYGGSQIRDDYDMAPWSKDGMNVRFNGWSVDSYYYEDLAVWDDDAIAGKEATLSMTVEAYTSGMTPAYDSFFEREYVNEYHDENGEVVSSERVLSHNKILLYTFSEEFYKYVVAQELKDENADFFAGIAPSNFCYTNIRNGFGAFAGVSRQETDWITPEFIEKNR